jgi:hypothetical protein
VGGRDPLQVRVHQGQHFVVVVRAAVQAHPDSVDLSVVLQRAPQRRRRHVGARDQARRLGEQPGHLAIAGCRRELGYELGSRVGSPGHLARDAVGMGVERQVQTRARTDLQQSHGPPRPCSSSYRSR